MAIGGISKPLGFLDLPTELRIMVYENYEPSGTVYLKRRYYRDDIQYRQRGILALSQTNTRIRSDVFGYYLKNHLLRLLPYPIRWMLESLDTGALSALTRIEVNNIPAFYLSNSTLFVESTFQTASTYWPTAYA